MSFTPRLIGPTVYIDYYRNVNYNGGKNKCLVIDQSNGFVLPNCVGYAWGRFYEITGTEPKLATSNADTWYSKNNDGLVHTRNYVNLGSIICYGGGNYSGDGHVAVVERFNSDGSITLSNSAYNGQVFYLSTVWPKYNLIPDGSGYYFQGVILNPDPSVPKRSLRMPFLYYYTAME